jgi:hypothetical protein
VRTPTATIFLWLPTKFFCRRFENESLSSIPSSVGQFKNLKSLCEYRFRSPPDDQPDVTLSTIKNSSLDGTIPTQIGNLTNLLRLSVQIIDAMEPSDCSPQGPFTQQPDRNHPDTIGKIVVGLFEFDIQSS